MSITVRSWSDKELEAIKSGKSKWLATVFMNASTFGTREIKYYPYSQRKQYVAYLKGANDPIVFYATDARNARKFINAEYKTGQYPIVDLQQISVRQRSVMRK
jgi:hypothetical protein